MNPHTTGFIVANESIWRNNTEFTDMTWLIWIKKMDMFRDPHITQITRNIVVFLWIKTQFHILYPHTILYPLYIPVEKECMHYPMAMNVYISVYILSRYDLIIFDWYCWTHGEVCICYGSCLRQTPSRVLFTSIVVGLHHRALYQWRTFKTMNSQEWSLIRKGHPMTRMTHEFSRPQ